MVPDVLTKVQQRHAHHNIQKYQLTHLRRKYSLLPTDLFHVVVYGFLLEVDEQSRNETDA